MCRIPMLIPLVMLKTKYNRGGRARPSAMGEIHSRRHACHKPAASSKSVAPSAAIVLFTANTTGK
jgi:hypothetical protein